MYSITAIIFPEPFPFGAEALEPVRHAIKLIGRADVISYYCCSGVFLLAGNCDRWYETPTYILAICRCGLAINR